MASGGRPAGKVAVVTGAGGGIGSAICRRFASEGAQVVCADVDLARAEDTAAGIGSAAIAIRCDVSSEADAQAAADRAVAAFGGLDVLVNNAAVWIGDATVETIDMADWNRTIGVNITGAVLMSRYAIAPMRSRGGGSIIHIASQLGHVGRAGRFWYCTAKAALIHLATCMAIDHAQDGIRVNSLSPGPIATDRIVALSGSREAANAFHGPLTLLGRPGHQDEIADGALFLASSESRYMTGTDLLIDGGFVAR